MIGKTISHYKIIKKLGGGGMGVVYKAEDMKLRRFVALKFLPLEVTRDEEAKKRFIHEAQAASALDHANICTVHDIDETDDGQLFICLTYYDGETIKKKIADGPLNPDVAQNYTMQIAQGLMRAHKAGIIHRDIKPANVIITEHDEVKIVDFGLAKLAGQTQLTKTGTVMGTVAYMSPEQAQGEIVDHRSDIWALGVVFYEMLTGQLPFKGEYDQAVLYSILAEEPQPVREISPYLPEVFEQIINKALAKNPDKRYQTINDMLTDLSSLAPSTPPKSSAEQTTQTFVRNKKQSYSMIGIAAIAILVVTSLLYFLFKDMVSIAVPENGILRDRIAVLPFDNISPNPDDEYFADGMTEELISTLSKILDLKVIARASVMRYKNATNTIAEIGNDLKVNTVLDGSVRIAENQLRINVQLIDVETEEHLWSHEYDKEFRDVFAIQNDIAESVAQALKLQLLETEKKQINKVATENLAAYQLYLQGRFNWNKRTPETLQSSIAYFEQSIAEDSLFALAYTGLADAYALLGSLEYGVQPPIKVMPIAKSMATKAVALDETLVEAQTSLANITLFYDWDWRETERLFKHAISLDRNYATAHHWYATYLNAMGRSEDAMREINRALEHDPKSLIINTDAGWFLYYSRDFEGALEKIQEAIELDANFIQAYLALGLTYIQLGMHTEATGVFEKTVELTSGYPITIALLGHVYGLSGKKTAAKSMLDRLNAIAADQYIAPLYFALIYLGLGEINRTMDWIEKAYQERSGYLVYLKIDPIVDPLRANPRFQALLKKMKLD